MVDAVEEGQYIDWILCVVRQWRRNFYSAHPGLWTQAKEDRLERLWDEWASKTRREWNAN